jgi:hypothetical protein
MSGGMPIPEEIAREVREMVERAAGPEIIRAVREAHRETEEMVSHMTSEEFARWIMGDGWVEK